MRVIQRFKQCVLTISVVLVGLPASAQAATNLGIVGGTNGAACDSGGYFSPSATTVMSGDTVTISVPSDDPYTGGLEIHGFPEGSFTVLPGESHSIQIVTTAVSYYGTWPSTGCMKGSGTIAVSAASVNATPAPLGAAAQPPPPATAPPNPSPPQPKTRQRPSAPAPTATQISPALIPLPSTAVSKNTPPSTGPLSNAATHEPVQQLPPISLAAGIGGDLLVFGAGAWAVWLFVVHKKVPTPQPPPKHTPDN